MKLLETGLSDQQDSLMTINSIMSEIQTLAKMKHANLMTISDVLKEKEESKLKFLLFMEYCEDDLRNFIKDQKFQDFEEKLQIMYEI